MAAAGRRLGSIRSRLTLLATAAVTAVLVVSAFGLVDVQRRVLTHGIDESLIQRADNLTVDIRRGTFGARLPTEGDSEDTFLQLLDGAGGVIASSDNVVGMPAAAGPLPPRSGDAFGTGAQPRLSRNDFRLLTRSVVTGSQPATLVVAKNLDDVHESVRILTLSLLLAIPVVILLLAALVWWLTGRVLRPVESIRAEVASIQAGALHRRVPVPDSQDEISRLARTMNGMLDRVQNAVERQQEFVADASHELRSPLTRIRADLELALAEPGPEPQVTLSRLLADADQLQVMLDDLLFLARSESGGPAAASGPVDLDDLVLEEAGRLRERGRVEVDAGAVSAARIRGDPRQLSRAIRNLGSNAERHASSVVRFELRERNGQSELMVDDDGPGIPAEHRASVFKRFTRLDEARSRDDGGAGLGLAIVQAIVSRHGGTIDIATAPSGGARFVLTLPRSD